MSLANFIFKLKKILFLIFLIFFTFSCSSNKFGYNKLIGSGNLDINEYQLLKFVEYLKGNFYSDELRQNTYNNVPIFFAVSKDGSSSIIVSCYSKDPCNLGIKTYQFLQKYSKKFKKDLFIFALENRVVWDNSSTMIQRHDYEKNERKYLLDKLLKNSNINYKKKSVINYQSYSLLVLPDESCNGGSDDC